MSNMSAHVRDGAVARCQHCGGQMLQYIMTADIEKIYVGTST